MPISGNKHGGEFGYPFPPLWADHSHQHLVVQICFCITAFSSGRPLGQQIIPTSLKAAVGGLYVAQTLLGDALVVSRTIIVLVVRVRHRDLPKMYRCYSVWRSFWPIALPFVTWVAGECAMFSGE